MAYGVLAAALVAYLAVVTPWLGRHTYDRLVRDRDRDPAALVRMFRLWIADTWAVTAVALAVVWLAPQLDAARVGLTLGADTSFLGGFLRGGLFGLPIGVALLVAVRRRAGRAASEAAPAPPHAAMLPRTRAERWHAAAMSVTAGVGEEIVYRGVLIAIGTHLLGLPVAVAAVLALALFAVGHLYQGAVGMLAAAAVGGAFTMLYLGTGSLLLPIALHTVIDLCALLVRSRLAGTNVPG